MHSNIDVMEDLNLVLYFGMTLSPIVPHFWISEAGADCSGSTHKDRASRGVTNTTNSV